MNTDNNEFDPSIQELEAKLSQWKAAPPAIDPKILFYQAGFAAANSLSQARVTNQRWLMAASLLVATSLSSILSFQAGQSSFRNDTKISTNVTSQENPSELSASNPNVVSQATPAADTSVIQPSSSPAIAPTDLAVVAFNKWLKTSLDLHKVRRTKLLASLGPTTSRNTSLPTESLTEPPALPSRRDDKLSEELMSIYPNRKPHSLRWSDFLPAL